MENLDLILLTTVISVLFMVFLIATYREFSEMNKSEFKGGQEKGPRAEMVRFLGKIFADESIEPGEKNEFLSTIKKAIEKIEAEKTNGNMHQ